MNELTVMSQWTIRTVAGLVFIGFMGWQYSACERVEAQSKNHACEARLEQIKSSTGAQCMVCKAELRQVKQAICNIAIPGANACRYTE